MFAVYKREFKAYMSNVYGWLFMAVLLLFIGVSMFIQNLLFGAPNIEYALLGGEYTWLSGEVALLLMIPVLCMRSMAEDKRNKTDMFYLSLPLQTSSVVLGKYFALLTVYAIPCAVICVYPVVLGMFGNVNFLGSYVAILFFFLLGAALIAVCQFLSSLTDNLVVAAVLGVVATAALFFLPMLAYLLPATAMVSFVGLVILAVLIAGIAFLVTRNLNVTAITGAALIVPLSVLYIIMGDKFAGLLPSVLEFMAPFLQFEEVGYYGLFDIRSLVLLLSYSVFFVFLTVQSADKKRWA
ncbi:MAG: ABC transporter permease [Clostridia bacterium]|nr:ABC transporter permease [Clostridia bacterium]